MSGFFTGISQVALSLENLGRSVSEETLSWVNRSRNPVMIDVSAALHTYGESTNIQAIFRSVKELSVPLVLHEFGAIGLDIVGLSFLGFLLRCRGRSSFSLKGMALLVLVPPYFAKAEREEKIKEVLQITDAELLDGEEISREIEGMKKQAFRDFINLNFLQLLALLLLSFLATTALPFFMGESFLVSFLSLMTASYVRGYFLLQYPLARDGWQPSSMVFQLSRHSTEVLTMGLLAEVGHRGIVLFHPVLSLPLKLSWDLSLMLFALHLQGGFLLNPLMKDKSPRPRNGDPGFLLWTLMDRILSRYATNDPSMVGTVWGCRVRKLLDSSLAKQVYSLRKVMESSAFKGLLNFLSLSPQLSSLVTNETAFIVNEYAGAIQQFRDGLEKRRALVDLSKTALTSRVFSYLGRPIVLYFYGTKGTIGSVILASDFIKMAFPTLTVGKIASFLQYLEHSLERPILPKKWGKIFTLTVVPNYEGEQSTQAEINSPKRSLPEADALQSIKSTKTIKREKQGEGENAADEGDSYVNIASISGYRNAVVVATTSVNEEREKTKPFSLADVDGGFFKA